MAMPIPPPMHREATPLLPPSLWRACNRVTSTLQPDIPMGCPREMAPPLTFTYGGKERRVGIACSDKGCISTMGKKKTNVYLVNIQTKLLNNSDRLGGERFVDLK